MYKASSAFHQAATSGAEQKALLIFESQKVVFTDMDIAVDAGIEFNDYFCTDGDLAIGQANSNEISFTLFNDDGRLNNFAFGDFTATLGVKTGETTFTGSETTRVVVGSSTWRANSASPYLTRNGNAVSSQPSFPVKSMLSYNGRLYAFGDAASKYKVYNATSGAVVSETVNAIVRNTAAKRWAGKGMYYHANATSGLDSTILEMWENGRKKTYEFVPLGKFTAERPNQPDQIQLHMTCYDFMQKFDIDMPDATALGVTYPSTLRNLAIKMCTYAGVEHVLPASFINSTATISAEPEDFANSTMRDVIKWIAEAAGSNARFNRDGKFALDWIRTPSNDEQTYLTYDEGGYSEYNPYWYQTKQITKLYNRDTQGGADRTVGSGDEGYLIQDNPLLKGVN